MTRFMYAVVNQKLSWSFAVSLTKKACDELAFWDENVDSLNFHSSWAPLQPSAKFVYSDAPDHACSSFIANDHIKIGVWQKVLKAQLGLSLGT